MSFRRRRADSKGTVDSEEARIAGIIFRESVQPPPHSNRCQIEFHRNSCSEVSFDRLWRASRAASCCKRLIVKEVKSGDKKRMTYELCFTIASYCGGRGGSIREIFPICSVKIPLGYLTARVERRFASRSR